MAAQIIADCDGDPRAAVSELVAIVSALLEENPALAKAASPGYTRRSLRQGRATAGSSDDAGRDL